MSKIPRHKLAEVLAEAFDDVPAKKLGEEIAAYLLAERRTDELDSLLRDVQQYRANHGIVEVLALCAHDLTEKTRRDIEAQVRELYPNAKRVIIVPEHDPNVIGGVKIELANQQLDLSVRSKLNRFKQLTETGV